MQKLRVGVCFLVGFFGTVAAVLGIAAEIKHVRARQVIFVDGGCYYPNTPALALGLLAALFLLIAQIIANASGGCICCRANRNYAITSTNRTVAILCLVLSWITFADAFFLLLEGAAFNGQQQYSGGWVHSCYIIKPGVFAAGAGLGLFTVALDIMYYLMATSGMNVAVGQPAMPTHPETAFPQAQICQFPLCSLPPIAYPAAVELQKAG